MIGSAEFITNGLGRRFLVAGVVAPVLLLGGTACGLVGSGSGDSAETESEPVEDGGNGDDTDQAEDQEDKGEGDSASSALEDRALDVDVRHPNGTSLKLTQLSFEGNDIMLDFELINSGRKEIEFHRGNKSGARLRLVDNEENEYLFAEDGETEEISLDTGETLSGTLAFLGPLSGELEQLYLVTNERGEDNLDSFDMDEESDGTKYPSFVLPLVGSGE